MITALGVDIGGTKICAGLVDAAGIVLRADVTRTPALRGPGAVLDAAAALAHHVVGGDPVAGCGVGTAGTVDTDGVVAHATDALPGWHGTDVRAELARRLELPVAVVNDVHCAALGEARFGAAAGHTVLVVMAGTGIGGAVVRDGRLEAGAHRAAGAVGHVPAGRTEQRRCPCGRVDHVEAYASGPAIAARYARLTGRGAVGLPDVAALERDGDPTAAHVIADAATVLGLALGGIANVLDPDVVVVGGGVTTLGAAFLGPLETAYRAAALPGPDRAGLRPAALGPHAAVIGAATLVLPPSPEVQPCTPSRDSSPSSSC